MTILTGFTQNTDMNAAATELAACFADQASRMVLFFAAPSYDPHQLSRTMQEAFPEAEVFGCTTGGEITAGRILTHSIVAMSLDRDEIGDIAIEVVTDIRTKCDIASAFSGFEAHFNQPAQELEFDRYIGIILVDGLQGREEQIMDEIGDLTNIRFVGGSAADYRDYHQTFVFAGGNAYTNAAVLALLKPEARFDILKTQSFRPLDQRFTVTKAVPEERIVTEFDHMPAVAAYTGALGMPVEDAKRATIRHPVGPIVDGEPFVRSPRELLDDGRMIFSCNMPEGMEVALLESTDIIADTRKDLAEVESAHGGLRGIILFNCLHRAMELEDEGRMAAYGKLFSHIPIVGFHTYGEQYLGHMNQTATMIVFA